MMTEQENALMIPLYGLFYIEDVRAFEGLSEASLQRWKETYTEAELKGIHDAVRWAVSRPEHNFRGILSGIRHSNEDIHLFFCKLCASMSRLA